MIPDPSSYIIYIWTYKSISNSLPSHSSQMQKYILFDYSLLLDDEGEDYVDSVIVKLYNPADLDQSFEQEYHQLQKEDNFQKMVLFLLHFINQEAVKFNNVMLVAPSTKFFTCFLEEEFRKRNLEMVFVLENYIDLQKEFRKIEGVALKSLTEMAEYYKEFQLWSNISKMRVVLMQLSTKKMSSREGSTQREPQNPQKYGFSEKERLSSNSEGSEISKKDERRGLWDSNELYKRSIPIQSSEQESHVDNYEESRLDLDQRRTWNGYPPSHQYRSDHSSFDSGRQVFYQKRPESYSRRSEMFRYAGEERRTRQLPHNLVRNEAMIRNAVRVRGLPFEMKEVEIVDLFSYFSPLPSSLKIGRRYGQKTGQAALLFTSQDLAERALEMNGYQIYGRFLEVMLISSQSYSQFT